MTMRNRNRASVPRRRRFWTTSDIDLTLVAATAGVASQKFTAAVFSSVTAKLDTSILNNLTIARAYLNGFWRTSSVVTAAVLTSYAIGLGLFPAGMDDTDFPDLSAHDGDWLLHDSRKLIEVDNGPAVVAPLLPQSGEMTSGLRIGSSAMRKITRLDERPFVVVQKADVTEDNIHFDGSLTILWLN